MTLQTRIIEVKDDSLREAQVLNQLQQIWQQHADELTERYREQYARRVHQHLNFAPDAIESYADGFPLSLRSLHSNVRGMSSTACPLRPHLRALPFRAFRPRNACIAIVAVNTC